MSSTNSRHTSVASLLGTKVVGSDGKSAGRVAELLVDGRSDGTHVTAFILSPSGNLRNQSGKTVDVRDLVFSKDGTVRLRGETQAAPWVPSDSSIFLDRDVLDQQIIDVHGHKVVRVNDVDLVWEIGGDQSTCDLRIAEVEVGMRGAIRRLFHGLPTEALDRIACRFKPSVIPWEFVDLIDRDPARRVRLKVEQDRLSRMHPSDIAEILEDLAPAERDAVFTSLNEEIAAEALEEVDPKLQRSLIEHMESSRVADIVEEMDPGAAADLLAELPEERSDAILEHMEPEERQEVEELLEFSDNEAAGQMTTEYVSVIESATVADAIEALRAFEGYVETITDIFLVDGENRLRGVVNLARLVLSPASTPLHAIEEERVHCCNVDATSKQIAEQFDKYNLRALPVLSPDGSLEGVIYAEHVIALLRERQ